MNRRKPSRLDAGSEDWEDWEELAAVKRMEGRSARREQRRRLKMPMHGRSLKGVILPLLAGENNKGEGDGDT